MKHKLSFLAILLMALAIPQSVKASLFFSAIAPNGQVLYYYVPDATTNDAYVTSPGYGGSDQVWNGYEKPTGDLVIPDSVEHGGETYTVVGFLDDSYTFSCCDGLTSVTMPDWFTSIPLFTFSQCYNLTTITIPGSVNSIGSCAFQHCNSLETVNYTGTIAQWCAISFLGGRQSNPLNFARHFYVGGNEVKNMVIPEGAACITEYAFISFDSLRSVTIPRSVKEIGNNAFYGCNNLQSVTFNADSCYYAGVFKNNNDVPPFYGCNSITEFTIGNNVKLIPENLCCNLDGLTSVNIPNSVMTIGDTSFAGCSNLQSVTIGDNCRYIGRRAFENCALTAVSIPNSVTTLGSVSFGFCSSLSSVVVGNGVTDIPSGAFYSCNHITNLSLGSRVQTIASDAFSGCNAVLRLTSRATVPPTAPSNPFTEFDTGIPVYVPCSSVDAYRNAAYWGFFTNIQCDNTGIEDIDDEGINIYSRDGHIVVDGAEGETVQVYDMTGHAVSCESLPSGTYVVRVGNYPARKVVVIR